MKREGGKREERGRKKSGKRETEEVREEEREGGTQGRRGSERSGERCKVTWRSKRRYKVPTGSLSKS